MLKGKDGRVEREMKGGWRETEGNDICPEVEWGRVSLWEREQLCENGHDTHCSPFDLHAKQEARETVCKFLLRAYPATIQPRVWHQRFCVFLELYFLFPRERQTEKQIVARPGPQLARSPHFFFFFFPSLPLWEWGSRVQENSIRNSLRNRLSPVLD